jgi:endo-1,4-beta-D-glucanase Y
LIARTLLLLVLILSGQAPAAAPTGGAVATGAYPNLVRQWDPRVSDAAIRARLEAYWSSLFGTDPDRRVYYPGEANADGPTAYIFDVWNDDVRSEGMSYGMMIAVQMNRKAEFDALWNWASSHMLYRSGPSAGYFRWQCTRTGCPRDAVPDSDGEEYFATALFFAAHRWGNGKGVHDYEAAANAILDTMLHKEEMNGGRVGGVTNMFDRARRQVVFVPSSSGSGFTDPSYHLPAFYELWGRWAKGWQGRQAEDRAFWRAAAAESRRLFVRAAHPATGLSPDYAGFDGKPVARGGHGDFRYDAFRVAANWSVDWSWWAAAPAERQLSDRLQAFFAREGMETYVSQYALDGRRLADDRSPALIASNAVASLAATESRRHEFVAALWALEPPEGRGRYYSGLLQFMALLHVSGNFRAY